MTRDRGSKRGAPRREAGSARKGESLGGEANRPTSSDREDIEGLVERITRLRDGARVKPLSIPGDPAYSMERDEYDGFNTALRELLVGNVDTILAALQSPAPVQGDRGEQSGWLDHQTGSVLSFDDGILNLSRDGSATLVFRDEVLEWKTNDKTGKEYRYATLPASEVRAIQDELNKRFPPALTTDAALIASLQDKVEKLTEGLHKIDAELTSLVRTANASPHHNYGSREAVRIMHEQATAIIHSLLTPEQGR